MKIEIIPCLSDNYSYLIFEKKTNTVSIVDPSEFNSCDKVIKKYKKLDFILNTHHHTDHVNGNLKLKEKYGSKILGYNLDKDRIPGIDICLLENQEEKIGNLKFKVIFIPGHTSGHVAFYFREEKIVFTGDTLFSLGCGKVFEGTHEDMFNSLVKLKSLPSETKVYCGHEYTKTNLDFCLKYDPKNTLLKDKSLLINSKIKENLPTIPTTIGDEIKLNIFLRYDDIRLKQALNLEAYSDQEVFSKLRDLKDTF
ncbi:MAG: hydroxyacylglutathione hydrolase [Candidatus Pelagibacter sp. TMED272]|mgnify:CR=1 FL=1|nr:hydroxyacylglutathione hydrolase [Pelagibacteraceae bacterium]RPG93676.1 MAG: hydroxyacylglutathione hydrolase [Candidatus Pelagibacter sp. TMED272]|tara:strand:+ start:1767 stop:2525 length:759 start_codon:yes stop_codon:yes gene_type:complete